MRLSIVIPVLQEEATIRDTLVATRGSLESGDQIVVVDGGSSDGTVRLARSFGAEVIEGERGRGRQMNQGASLAGGDVLLFLHADTLLPTGFRQGLAALLEDESVRWGRFDLRFDEGGPLLQLIARLISLRSRLFRSATGDQAIFVRREDFLAVGGYREAILFEDVDLVRLLRRRGRMGIPAGHVVTSARRWRNRGVWPTTLRMWALKSLYLCGVPASRLSRHYRDER
ncbi:MAG: TIGR04283 family arsenosugar biosynthesis glycosyltransferase [Candidatus Binatia bacterium]